MLTVLHKDTVGGESVFQARRVTAGKLDQKSDNIKFVECVDEKNGNETITHGIVYVMNDNGKTVATYYLNQSAN